MQDNHDIKISAVIFREGDLWIAQALEYDICIQAKSLEEVPKAFSRAVIANAVVCVDLGREPCEGIAPAPKKFWEMFRLAQLKMEAEPAPIRVPHPAFLPSVVPQYRVIDRTA